MCMTEMISKWSGLHVFGFQALLLVQALHNMGLRLEDHLVKHRLQDMVSTRNSAMRGYYLLGHFVNGGMLKLQSLSLLLHVLKKR